MNLLNDAGALRNLHARARGWTRALKLPFRQQRWRGHAGEFMGSGTGSSLDFHDHRVYLPGDDPRQINWQAYARTGTYSMKLYREEVRPLVDMVLDVSASMFAFPSKEQRALELLQAGAGNVTEVAYAVGFESLSSFARAFRQRHGQAPSEVLSSARASFSAARS